MARTSLKALTFLAVLCSAYSVEGLSVERSSSGWHPADSEIPCVRQCVVEQPSGGLESRRDGSPDGRGGMLTISRSDSLPDGIVCAGWRMARQQAAFSVPSLHALGIRLQA